MATRIKRNNIPNRIVTHPYGHLRVRRWGTQDRVQGRIVLVTSPGEQGAPFCQFFFPTLCASSCSKILMTSPVRKNDPVTGPARDLFYHSHGIFSQNWRRGHFLQESCSRQALRISRRACSNSTVIRISPFLIL